MIDVIPATAGMESIDHNIPPIAQQRNHSIDDMYEKYLNNTGANNNPDEIMIDSSDEYRDIQTRCKQSHCISSQLDEILMNISTSSFLLKQVQKRVESQNVIMNNTKMKYRRRHSLESYITTGERSSMPFCFNSKMILQRSSQKIVSPHKQSRRFSMPTAPIMNFDCPPTPPIRTKCSAVGEEIPLSNDQSVTMETLHSRIEPSRLSEMKRSRPSIRRISLPGLSLSSVSSLETVLESQHSRISMSSKLTELPRSKQNIISRRHSLEPNTVLPPSHNIRHIFDSPSVETIPLKNRRMSLQQQSRRFSMPTTTATTAMNVDNSPPTPPIRSRCAADEEIQHDHVMEHEKEYVPSCTRTSYLTSLKTDHMEEALHSRTKPSRFTEMSRSCPSIRRISLPGLPSSLSLPTVIESKQHSRISLSSKLTELPRSKQNKTTMSRRHSLETNSVVSPPLTNIRMETIPFHRRMSLPDSIMTNNNNVIVSDDHSCSNRSRFQSDNQPRLPIRGYDPSIVNLPKVVGIMKSRCCTENVYDDDDCIYNEMANHSLSSKNHRRMSMPYLSSSPYYHSRARRTSMPSLSSSSLLSPSLYNDNSLIGLIHRGNNMKASSNHSATTGNAFTLNETNYNRMNHQRYTSPNVYHHRRMSMPGLSSSCPPPSSSFQTDYMISDKINYSNNVSCCRRRMSMPLLQTQSFNEDGIISHHVVNHNQVNQSYWNEDSSNRRMDTPWSRLSASFNNYDYNQDYNHSDIPQRLQNNNHYDNSYHPNNDDATYDISIDYDDSDSYTSDDNSYDEETEDEEDLNDDDNDPSSIVNFPKVVMIESHCYTKNNEYDESINRKKANHSSSSPNHRRMSMPHLSSSSSYSHTRTRRASMSHCLSSSLLSPSLCNDNSLIGIIRHGTNNKSSYNNSAATAGSSITSFETNYNRMNHHQRYSSSNIIHNRRMSMPGLSSSLPSSSYQPHYMASTSENNCSHNESCSRRRRMSMPAALQTQQSCKDGIISHHVMNHNRSNYNDDSNDRRVNIPWSRSSVSSLTRYNNYDANKDNNHSVIRQRLRNNHDDSYRPSDNDYHNDFNSGYDDHNYYSSEIDEEYSISEGGIEEQNLNDDDEGNVTIHIENDRQKQTLLYPSSSCKQQQQSQKKKIRLKQGTNSAATVQITITSHTGK